MQQQRESVLPANSPSLPLGQLRSVVRQVVGVQEQCRTVLEGLTELATGTGEQVDQLATRVRQLEEVQKHTNEKLDALIAVVDGLVQR